MILHEAQFKELISNSGWINQAIDIAETLAIPNYYIAGGVVAQVIWNQLTGQDIHSNIKDVDVIYFDASESKAQRAEREASFTALSKNQFLPDMTNQAFVHEWYRNQSGGQVKPLTSAGHGIDTWLSAFAVGIRGRDYQIYAPYGLTDLFAMQLRPNSLQMGKAVYLKMVAGYTRRWPQLRADPWDDSSQDH
ncbi:nucleotidyltransferase family protein [Iodobacter sp. HSC-16F04]|uniref:Nucleotidyltransferase family protein n=1 Tax=Iodobacter violaceini TaxID=3044271 RepID=A0ABX0KSJ3_9NEIS|nr:nucleotidyltransferase family protein [Iodobacter violacea]NHQ85032.1 nucleotidyltransferase family protein [Iodobacter violacea]